jgi:quinol monooxygenase YgiN
MISLVVKIPLKEGKAAEFTEAFKEIAVGVATEENNLLYSLSYKKDAPDTAVIMERYTDMAALGVHSQADYFKAFNARTRDLVTGAPDVMVMEEVAAA